MGVTNDGHAYLVWLDLEELVWETFFGYLESSPFYAWCGLYGGNEIVVLLKMQKVW